MQPDLQVTSVAVAALVPYAENARTHSEAQVAQIAASIAEFGFVNPVLVDAAGVLVAGHGRVMAAKRLGMAVVPAIRLAHLTEAQARALRLADNQIALNSGWDEALLAAEIARIPVTSRAKAIRSPWPRPGPGPSAGGARPSWSARRPSPGAAGSSGNTPPRTSGAISFRARTAARCSG